MSGGESLREPPDEDANPELERPGAFTLAIRDCLHQSGGRPPVSLAKRLPPVGAAGSGAVHRFATASAILDLPRIYATSVAGARENVANWMMAEVAFAGIPPARVCRCRAPTPGLSITTLRSCQ